MIIDHDSPAGQVLAYLSRSPAVTEAQVRAALLEQGMNPETARPVLRMLGGQGLLNRYIQKFPSRYEITPKGTRALVAAERGAGLRPSLPVSRCLR